MLTSKYGKTYDTANGSEQRFESPMHPERPGSQRGGQIGRERWEDDGGPANDEPVPVLASQPAWSVLPLRDLNDLIRRELSSDDSTRLRLEGERAERRDVAARQQNAANAVDAIRARNERYRNAWENT